jgi:DNA topoisomerase-1
MVRERFGTDWLPAKVRVVRSTARDARAAHEPVRPTDFSLAPKSLAGRIGGDAAGLYALIWQRAVVSQMAATQVERTRVELASEGLRKAGGDKHGAVLRAVEIGGLMNDSTKCLV